MDWKMWCGQYQKNILLMTVLIFGVFSFLGTAGAMNWRLGDDTELVCDVTLTYGTGIRVSDQDDELLTDINNDDANRNFDQWDFINNKVVALADLEFAYKNAGVFMRPKAFYDHVYMTDNANDSPETNNAFVGDLIGSSYEWHDEIEDIHGRNAEILDLFGFFSFYLADREIDFRVGKQVISWGESLLIAGGISSAQSPVDASAAVAVGTEVKEIYLPTESAYLQISITPELGLGGYYQWKWEKTRLMEGGTFFARTDTLDEIRVPTLFQAGSTILSFPRGEDEEAKDDGQYGIALTYLLPWFDATEIGAYYINYHDKNPLVLFDETGSLYSKFTEDIKLYGFSVSSMLGDANVSGEFSYRQDVGFQSADEIGTPMVEMGDYWQAQTSAIYMMSLRSFADSFLITGEVACGQEVDREENEFAWTYSVMAGFDWFEVFPKTSMGLNLAGSDVISGSNLLGDEGYASASIGIDFLYNNQTKGALTYENRYNRNAYKDRDTITFSVSYSF